MKLLIFDHFWLSKLEVSCGVAVHTVLLSDCMAYSLICYCAHARGFRIAIQQQSSKLLQAVGCGLGTSDGDGYACLLLLELSIEYRVCCLALCLGGVFYHN